MGPATRRGDRIVTASVTCFALFALQGCVVTRLLDRPWVEVESEHFTITSAMNGEDTERLARTLELFRASVLRITNTASLDSNVPTRVFFFDGPSTFGPFRPSRHVVGYLQPDLRANFIAIVDTRRMDAERLIRHEYVHFLMRNGSRRAYPRWYDEGFAELLSTTKLAGQYVTVGAVPEDRVQQIARTRWIPMRRILAYDGTQRWTAVEVAMFYAESWALLHYLSRDFEHAVKLAPSVQTYLDRIEQGGDVEEAWQAAFGMSTEQLDNEVRRHLRQGSFAPLGVRKTRIQWSDEIRSRVPGRAELAERLGELALVVGNRSYARPFFRAALLDDPELARAHAGLGDLLERRGRWDEAEQHLARAVELGPDDPLNELDHGEYWLSRARETPDVSERRDLLERARRHLIRALDMDERRPEPWAIHGSTFLLEGEDPSESLEWLERALQLLPSSLEVQLLLAEAYVAVDRRADARSLLVRIVSWSHGGRQAERARELLAQLESASDAQEP